jgi:hypothetical protein
MVSLYMFNVPTPVRGFTTVLISIYTLFTCLKITIYNGFVWIFIIYLHG